MTKTNPSLKCNNTLINELNKEYFVMSNFNGDDGGWYMYFGSGGVDMGYGYRDFGRSVRLVK